MLILKNLVNPVQQLQLQNAGLVHIKRLAITKDRNDDSQTHRSFRSRDRHHDEHEKLPGHVLKETRERHERQIHSIQHQLDTHEHRDHVALDDHARHSNREQDRG